MTISSVMIDAIRAADVEILASADINPRPASDYFARCLDAHKSEERFMFVARSDDQIIGYVQYNPRPLYLPFRNHGIPEIQDVYVMPHVRRHGIAKKLISFCEDRARAEGRTHIGIGVSVISSYTAAQILYVRLGYVPDGGGIVSHRSPVGIGASVTADDDLCMMLIKELP